MIKILAIITLALVAYHTLGVFRGNIAALVFEAVKGRIPVPEERVTTFAICAIVILEIIALVWSIIYISIFQKAWWLAVILIILSIYHIWGDILKIEINSKIVAIYSAIAYISVFIIII